jgi:hypothetical protein
MGGAQLRAANATGTLMTSPANIVDTVRDFVGQGYRHDFRVEDGELHDVTLDRTVDLKDIHVDAAFRFAIAPDADDASNLYAITDRKHGVKGLLIDAFDLLEELGGAPHTQHLGEAETVTDVGEGDVPTKFGLRKVAKAEFEADPERYVLRIDYPDFPACPFGESFSMLGFDTAEQTYVWLATKILRDDRLVRLPYQSGDVPDNA